MSGTMCSPNFEFLKAEDELLYEYAMRAERYVFDDPNTCLFKLGISLSDSLFIFLSLFSDHDHVNGGMSHQ